VLDTRVFGRISTADLVAAVSGAIIREDQLKISVCLIEVRLYRGTDVLLAVVDRHADADAWLSWRASGHSPWSPLKTVGSSLRSSPENKLPGIERFCEFSGRVCLKPSDAHQAMKSIFGEPVLVAL